METILFLIVSLLLLSMITGLKMLVSIWGKKYRYKNTWELLYSEEEAAKHKRTSQHYEQ